MKADHQLPLPLFDRALAASVAVLILRVGTKMSPSSKAVNSDLLV